MCMCSTSITACSDHWISFKTLAKQSVNMHTSCILPWIPRWQPTPFTSSTLSNVSNDFSETRELNCPVSSKELMSSRQNKYLENCESNEGFCFGFVNVAWYVAKSSALNVICARITHMALVLAKNMCFLSAWTENVRGDIIAWSLIYASFHRDLYLNCFWWTHFCINFSGWEGEPKIFKYSKFIEYVDDTCSGWHSTSTWPENVHTNKPQNRHT